MRIRDFSCNPIIGTSIDMHICSLNLYSSHISLSYTYIQLHDIQYLNIGRLSVSIL